VTSGIKDEGTQRVQRIRPAAVPACVDDAVFKAKLGGLVDIALFKIERSDIVVDKIGPYRTTGPYPGQIAGSFVGSGIQVGNDIRIYQSVQGFGCRVPVESECSDIPL